MSHNFTRISLTLVACLLGAAFVYGQNFTLRAQSAPAAGRSADVFFTPHHAGPPEDREFAKLSEDEHVLARESDDLARQLHDAENTGDRDKLKAQLREVLDKQFEIQRLRREQEITQIEQRVRKLREQLKRRSDERQKIIDRRIDQIISDADGLGWNPPNGGGPHGFTGAIFGGGDARPFIVTPGTGPVPIALPAPIAPAAAPAARPSRALEPSATVPAPAAR